MKDVFKNMGLFSLDVFHDSSAIGHLQKLKKEAEEAITKPDDIYEYADCLLCIYAAAYKSGFSFDEIEKACEDKFEILKTRKWKLDEDGLYQHY